jgi:hypothetical protein
VPRLRCTLTVRPCKNETSECVDGQEKSNGPDRGGRCLSARIGQGAGSSEPACVVGLARTTRGARRRSDPHRVARRGGRRRRAGLSNPDFAVPFGRMIAGLQPLETPTRLTGARAGGRRHHSVVAGVRSASDGYCTERPGSHDGGHAQASAPGTMHVMKENECDDRGNAECGGDGVRTSLDLGHQCRWGDRPSDRRPHRGGMGYAAASAADSRAPGPMLPWSPSLPAWSTTSFSAWS